MTYGVALPPRMTCCQSRTACDFQPKGPERELNVAVRKGISRLHVALFIVALLLIAFGSFGCSSGFVAGPPETVTATPTVMSDASNEAGIQAFAAHCAECHGASGQGHPDWRVRKADGTLNPPPLNGDGHTWHHSDGFLFRTVRDGGAIPSQPDFVSGMPSFSEKLNDEEIIHVLTYIQSLWEGKSYSGVPILEIQQERSAGDPFPTTAN